MREDKYTRITDVNQCWYRSMCSRCNTDECTITCKHLTQTKYLLDLSDLPESKKHPLVLEPSMLTPDSADYLTTVLDDIKNFVRSGFNLYLWGDTGSGKTSWAVKLLTNYFSAICEHNAFRCAGLYVSVPSFLRDAKLRMSYKQPDYQEYLQTIQDCDIVVWDDIIQTGPTEYESQWLYSYINERMFANKCNIFTSNRSPDELATLNAALHSRICTVSDCIEVTGYDMRGTTTYRQYLSNQHKNNRSRDLDGKFTNN